MKIGIIGSGNVGGTLGRRWASNGHIVTFGKRDGRGDSLSELLASCGPNATAGSISEAAQQSDVVLLATPWEAAQSALQSAGDLTGKVVIDATNPLLPGLSGLALGTNTSAGEMVAEWASGARVVKTFNTVGANIMDNPRFAGGPVAMFYCGDDADAKKAVASLISELGFAALDAGPLTQSRLLEPFALLWITLALKFGYTREIGFELLRRGNA